MRFKYYLRGCGLGIILTAAILSVGFRQSREGAVSDEEIMQRASELGMITPTDDRGSLGGTQQPGDGQEDQAVGTIAEPQGDDKEKDGDGKKEKDSGRKDSENGDSEKTDDDSEDSGNEDDDSEDSGNENSENENSEKKNSEKDNSEKEGSEADEPKTVTVVVRRGEVCRELAEDLYELGLVEDAEEFRYFMQRKGYDNMIRVGEFELTIGMDHEEIARVLIRG